jgi:YVTN family beta-propeller protein
MNKNITPTLVLALWLSCCSQKQDEMGEYANAGGSAYATAGTANATGGDSTAAGGPGAVGPKAYVGLFGDNAVAVVDTAANRVIKTIPVPAGPHGVVITPDGAKVYVSSDGATTVSVISTADDSVTGSIEVGMTPHGLSISADGKRVLLSDFGGDMAEVIDTATDQVAATVAVNRPHNSAISPDGRLAFEGSQQMGMPAIVVIDLDAAKVVSSAALQQPPRALDYAPNGSVYFTVSGKDELEVLDPKTNELGTPIATGGSPHHMLATKDGAFELVVSQTAGDLEYVDPKAGMVTAKVATGTTPHWIALSSDGKRAYVTDEGSNDLAVVDIAARSVVTILAVGKGPRKIAVQPAP